MSVSVPGNYYQYTDYNKNGKSLASKVEIRISCKDLPSLDSFSKSDPKVFIFLEKVTYNSDGTTTSAWENIDSTERIKNQDCPIFTKSFYIDYYFEMIQRLRFVVIDMDTDSNEWSKNDFIGYTEKTLGDLISGCEDNVYTAELLTEIPKGMKITNFKVRDNKRKGRILIKIKEVVNSDYMFNFDISGNDLDKKDTFGKSDPFIIISRIENNGEVC